MDISVILSNLAKNCNSNSTLQQTLLKVTSFWLINSLGSLLNCMVSIKLVYWNENLDMERMSIYKFIRCMCIVSLTGSVIGLGFGFSNLLEIGNCVQHNTDNEAGWEEFSSKIYFRQSCLRLQTFFYAVSFFTVMLISGVQVLDSVP